MSFPIFGQVRTAYMRPRPDRERREKCTREKNEKRLGGEGERTWPHSHAPRAIFLVLDPITLKEQAKKTNCEIKIRRNLNISNNRELEEYEFRIEDKVERLDVK